MKKKIIALSLSVVMIAVAAIGGTLAYFTDTDDAVNVMTMGNVQIVQNEYERVTDADGKKTTDLRVFTNNQTVFPAVYHVDGKDDGITDPSRASLTVNGCTISIRSFPNYVDKIVTVTNTGNSEAYVRTIVAVPVSNDDPGDGNVSENWLHWNFVTDTDSKDKNNGWYVGKTFADGEYPMNGNVVDYARFYTVDNVEIGGMKYELTVFTNVDPLAAGASTGPCMTGFYLDNDLNVDENGYFQLDANGEKIYIGNAGTGATPENIMNSHKILVATQAVQTAGFDGEDGAYRAFKASFGDITAINHPWVD